MCVCLRSSLVDLGGSQRKVALGLFSNKYPAACPFAMPCPEQDVRTLRLSTTDRSCSPGRIYQGFIRRNRTGQPERGSRCTRCGHYLPWMAARQSIDNGCSVTRGGGNATEAGSRSFNAHEAPTGVDRQAAEPVHRTALPAGGAPPTTGAPPDATLDDERSVSSPQNTFARCNRQSYCKFLA